MWRKSRHWEEPGSWLSRRRDWWAGGETQQRCGGAQKQTLPIFCSHCSPCQLWVRAPMCVCVCEGGSAGSWTGQREKRDWRSCNKGLGQPCGELWSCWVMSLPFRDVPAETKGLGLCPPTLPCYRSRLHSGEDIQLWEGSSLQPKTVPERTPVLWLPQLGTRPGVREGPLGRAPVSTRPPISASPTPDLTPVPTKRTALSFCRETDRNQKL